MINKGKALDTAVEHYYIDLRPAFLQQHLQQFVDENDKDLGGIEVSKRVPYSIKKFPKGFSKKLHKAVFFEKLMRLYGNNIEQMPFVKMIIDFHFIESEVLIIRYAFFYIFLVIFPFVAQLLIDNF